MKKIFHHRFRLNRNKVSPCSHNCLAFLSWVQQNDKILVFICKRQIFFQCLFCNLHLIRFFWQRFSSHQARLRAFYYRISHAQAQSTTRDWMRKIFGEIFRLPLWSLIVLVGSKLKCYEVFRSNNTGKQQHRKSFSLTFFYRKMQKQN